MLLTGSEPRYDLPHIPSATSARWPAGWGRPSWSQARHDTRTSAGTGTGTRPADPPATAQRRDGREGKVRISDALFGLFLYVYSRTALFFMPGASAVPSQHCLACDEWACWERFPLGVGRKNTSPDTSAGFQVKLIQLTKTACGVAGRKRIYWPQLSIFNKLDIMIFLSKRSSDLWTDDRAYMGKQMSDLLSLDLKRQFRQKHFVSPDRVCILGDYSFKAVVLLCFLFCRWKMTMYMCTIRTHTRPQTHTVVPAIYFVPLKTSQKCHCVSQKRHVEAFKHWHPQKANLYRRPLDRKQPSNTCTAK